MTAETSIDTRDDSSVTANVTTAPQLPAAISEIFDFLSENSAIVFKSQQIDDPELQRSEKLQIARDIYVRNRQTFLMRFGAYMDERHLQTFAQYAIADDAAPLKEDEHYDEMQFMLLDYQRKLKTRKQDVKNRRYTAMQQLLDQGDYFSELEMMKRAPELYQELVGQYLSAAEIKQRDSYDVRNTTFSGILMHTFEQQQMNDVLKQADKLNKAKSMQCILPALEDDQIQNTSSDDSEEIASEAVTEESEIVRNDDVEAEVPVSFRQQWGNFDNEQTPCSTSRVQRVTTTKSNTVSKRAQHRKSQNETFITAGERDLLRQEFIGIMHEQFLAGQDVDFDYTQVDDNTQLDDLRQLDQDKEDAYFEESDGDDNGDSTHIKRCSSEDEQSEDELDIYMSHLSQHHSLQS